MPSRDGRGAPHHRHCRRRRQQFLRGAHHNVKEVAQTAEKLTAVSSELTNSVDSARTLVLDFDGAKRSHQGS